ncbi:hypothetical protein [Shewanella phaeophyticola]|uniref:Uncharacterized protein n=1 Tax=Shewanella phaeophyticola TaxID=2978345 RepID=A0ABT2P3A9_9GAMM|nr:hypothetical protein [Shewanella sp. KJ10-1]MCT8985736.1 hypothetical protein [Shewanella sp. KJ10-1]
MQKDISIILVGTDWNNCALTKSLNSVQAFKENTGHQVECLIVEGLAKNVDVNTLNYEKINQLPEIVSEYLGFEDYNYYVDHLAVEHFFKRVLKAAQGRYFILLREGDQVGFTKSLNSLSF